MLNSTYLFQSESPSRRELMEGSSDSFREHQQNQDLTPAWIFVAAVVLFILFSLRRER